MSHQFQDDRIPDNVDPLDAPNQDFDWDELFERLDEESDNPQEASEFAQIAVLILQMVLPSKIDKRVHTRSLGIRLIALAWVLNPEYFEGSPSLRELAKRFEVRTSTLAKYTGHYSRLIGWRNRFGGHAWNWQQTNQQQDNMGQKTSRRNVPPIDRKKKFQSHSATGRKSDASTENKDKDQGRRAKAGIGDQLRFRRNRRR